MCILGMRSMHLCDFFNFYVPDSWCIFTLVSQYSKILNIYAIAILLCLLARLVSCFYLRN